MRKKDSLVDLNFKITSSGTAIFCIHATSLIVSINTNFVQSPSNSIWFDSSRSPTQHNKWWGCFQDFPYLLFKIHYITKERFLIPVNLQFLKSMMIMISQFRTNVLVSLFYQFESWKYSPQIFFWQTKALSVSQRTSSQSLSGLEFTRCKKQKNWLFEEGDSTQFHFQTLGRGVKKALLMVTWSRHSAGCRSHCLEHWNTSLWSPSGKVVIIYRSFSKNKSDFNPPEFWYL